MSTITDWLTGVGSDATVAVAIVAAVIAVRAVRESKRLREDQARPFVAVTLEPSGASRHFLDLVVRNHGMTMARDVQFSFDKDLLSTIDGTGYPIANVKFLHDGIATLAPRVEYRVLFDSMPARHEANRGGADMPDSYTVTVQYKNRQGDPLPPEEYVLDSALSRSAPYAQEFKMHDLVKEVSKLREAVQESATLVAQHSGDSPSGGRLRAPGRIRGIPYSRRLP